ncbi:acyl-CoA dehydrogenase family protein [Nonomuraea cavernae]|uniref:Acyl-CoA dehydrogenase n=1 Tax=Nonomuraea cavernae TaxID=2045107 RepID=A0A918DH47_9ACTN|nr:acyl-CoA dehydrogenase family protein [Nonomuraea cavernae]MCA2184918.1 acyl-CoA/acyl-ACP dehydrogenase [Nonomuraea cavernae]GGO64854.1 acyl-CoA dehydrogenase [Nonomuraea cavernae]
MDFNLDETQQDLRRLAADLLAKEATEERLREAGLLSVCVPEEAGGAGLGPVEMAVVLREVGARAAALPALPALAGSLALSRYGTRHQQTRSVTVAHREPGRALADLPVTTADRTPEGWVLTGRKTGVPYLESWALVTADEGVFLVESPESSPEYTSTGEPAATIVLDRTPAERVAGPEAVTEIRQIFTVAVAAQASGVLAGALELTTGYIRTRKQFGRALAEFQAVTMQIADVYIAGRALDVALWSAAWRLGQRLPAEEDLAVAAFHVGEALRALYTCQHLHGGLGLDVTYPLHRYFAQAKHLSHLLGGQDAQLDLIGALA